MATKKTKPAEADDDLLGGGKNDGGEGADDLLGGDKPATKKAAAKKTAAAPAKKTAAKEAPAAKKTAAKEAPAAKKTAPAKEAVERSARGEGKFYMTAEEKESLAKEIGKNKKPVSTKDLAAKLEVETWKVRRAINEVLVPAGKGSVEKVGTTLVYTP